uniref:Tonsoku-like protein n=2 Tax=Tetranychus urticae TaxID=32264 RepID=T1JWZ7_TETUR
MVGESLALLGSFRKSALHLKEFRRIAMELDNKEEMQRADATLGRTYWLYYNSNPLKNKQSLEKAELYFRSALTRASKLKGNISERDYAQMRTRGLINLALVFEQKGDKLAVKFLEEGTLLSKKFGFPDDLLRCLMALSAIHMRAGLMQKAREFNDDAMKVAKQLHDFTDLCELLLMKANILINLVDYDGARHIFKKVYQLYTKSSDPDHKIKAIKGCKATKKIIETLKEVNLSSDPEIHAKLYDKIGDYCVEMGCYSMAIDYYNRVLDAALKLGKSAEELATIYFSLGQTYLDNQQFSEALTAYQKELTFREGNTEEEIHSLLKIIEIKINLQLSFDEIQREFEFALTKCDTDKLKRQVLKEYKNYLDEANVVTSANKEIERQLSALGPEDVTEMECESQEGGDKTSDEEISDDDISDLTDDSGNENLEETEMKGRALRSRRSVKKIQSSAKRNEKGESALHRACIDGNLSHVMKLVEGGHEVNIRDHAGWLPIHEASNHGYADIVEYLIQKKSLINDRGGAECGDTTPLHDACANGHIDVIRVLIRNGANVIGRDINGNTPFDLLKDRIGDGETLTSTQKKDVALLFKEIKELMKKSGYDFNAKTIQKVKRKHVPSDVIGKPINNLRARDNRSPSTSPPRKSLKLNKNREAVDAKNAYKEVISNLRRPHDLVNGPPPAKSKSKFKGLIEESECVVDEWMINDMNPSALKDKPVRDAYEMTGRLIEKNQQSFDSSKRERQSKPKQKGPIASTRRRAVNSDEEDDYVVIEHDDVKSQSDNDSQDEDEEEEEENFDWERQLNGDDNEDDTEIEVVSCKNKSKSNRQETSYFTSTQESMDACSTTSPPPDSLPLSPPSSNQPMSYNFTPSTVPQIPSYSTVSPPSNGSNQQVPTKPTPVNQPNQSTEKFLITVHLESKKFLLTVPNRSTQVSWLAEKTAERYYQMRQLRPKLSLTTEEGAILDLDDLVVDVCLNNQVYANIDSWDLEPLPERYESNCKLKKSFVNHDLKFRLKLSETSGKLQLTNMLLERATIVNLLLSLRCQKSLRILDFSFTDIILLDKDDILSQILSTISDLEEINFKGTGLVSYRLHSLCRYPLTNLINVDFSYNLLDDKCSTNLLEFINQCPNLKRIDLRYNDFSLGFIESSNLLEISRNKNITLLMK